MASLAPFRALRPTPDSAARVAAVPYDVVSAEEAATLADGNALSFLRVSRAEIDLPPGTNPYGETVYAKAAENFTRLKSIAPLVVEDEEASMRTGFAWARTYRPAWPRPTRWTNTTMT